jgi:CO/xanthine dehydrogenase FAD-binding subunit
VGACSEVARRLLALEAALDNQLLDSGTADRVKPAYLAPISPIDDLRGTASYRREAALVMLRRSLERLAA